MLTQAERMINVRMRMKTIRRLKPMLSLGVVVVVELDVAAPFGIITTATTITITSTTGFTIPVVPGKWVVVVVVTGGA